MRLSKKFIAGIEKELDEFKPFLKEYFKEHGMCSVYEYYWGNHSKKG